LIIFCGFFSQHSVLTPIPIFDFFDPGSPRAKERFLETWRRWVPFLVSCRVAPGQDASSPLLLPLLQALPNPSALASLFLFQDFLSTKLFVQPGSPSCRLFLKLPSSPFLNSPGIRFVKDLWRSRCFYPPLLERLSFSGSAIRMAPPVSRAAIQQVPCKGWASS